MAAPERAAGAGGLCERCVHAEEIFSAKGSRFIRCGLSDTDPAYVKYPRLPVTACPGFSGRTLRPDHEQ